MRLEDLNVEMSPVQTCIRLMELESDDIACSRIIWVQHHLKVHREHVFVHDIVVFEVVEVGEDIFVCAAPWIVLNVLTRVTLIQI